jgi:hypothetical protein
MMHQLARGARSIYLAVSNFGRHDESIWSGSKQGTAPISASLAKIEREATRDELADLRRREEAHSPVDST